MSIIKKNEAYADMKLYVENNEGCTFGDIVQNCIKPALESIFGSLKYAVNTQGNPCILLPSSNGQTSASYAPCLMVDTKSTNIPAKNTVWIKVGIIDIIKLTTTTVHQPYEQHTSNGSSNGSGIVNSNFTDGGLIFRAMDIDKGYQFGFYTNIATYGSITLGSFGCKVLNGKEVINNKETDIVLVQGYGTDVNNPIKLIYHRPSTDTIVVNALRGWELPIQSTCANMYEFNDGIVTIEDHYICFPMFQRILAPLCVISVNETPYDMWSKEIVINGSKFRIAINPGNGDNGYSRVSLAKKVQ